MDTNQPGTCFAVLAVLLAGVAPGRAEQPPAKPNIVFILADDKY